MRDRHLAGPILFVGGAQFLLGLLFAEALYPGYSVANNYISDLGIGPEPSRTIFTASIIIFGLMGITAAALLLRSEKDRVLPLMLLVSGIGAVGVGLINEDYPLFHAIMALLAFVGGALVALFSYRMLRGPTGIVAAVLGIITLVALASFATGTHLGMGIGGMERLILYPALTWLIGLGAVLAASPADTAPTGPAR